MLDTTSYGSKPLRHDAETFQVAEELIMLSSRALSGNLMNGKTNNSPSDISGFFQHREKRVSKHVKVKKALLQRTHRTSTALVNQILTTDVVKAKKTKTRSSRGTAHQSKIQDVIKKEVVDAPAQSKVAPAQSEDIINSRCDISHLELLKEHRVRFRRVRRRWNVEQRIKNKKYLARFHVQGIPLVQHLETFNHWR